jgi:hypothetical protein
VSCCALGLGLSACGEPSGPGGVGGTSNGSGGSAAAGASGQAPGGSSASGASGSSAVAGTGTGGAPPAICSSYMDQNGWSLVVQISNQRKQVVYVGEREASCEPQRLFEVRDGSRALLPGLEGCHNSCQQLMQSGPVNCALACSSPATIALQPGETIKVPWDGRFGVPQTLPSECAAPAAQGATSCVQAERIEANVFTFSAKAGTARECLAGTTACSCTPNQNGGCTTPSSVISGTVITTELLLQLEPGETAPGGAPPYIGLVFKD